jgi:ribosomal protein S13
MARIAGVDLPDHKKLEVALTYLYGIGWSRAKEICEKTGIPCTKRLGELTPDELNTIRKVHRTKLQGGRRPKKGGTAEHKKINRHRLL